MKSDKSRWQFYLGIAALIFLAVLMVRHFHIAEFQTIEKDILYVSGQPSGMDYTRMLYKYHIDTIINVRSPAEHRDQNWHAEEMSWVKENGVSYVELPIDRNNYFPDKATQEKFIAIMADRNNLPVLLHGSGNTARVAMLTAVWMVKAKGIAPSQAAADVAKILERPVNSKENEFITSLSAQ